MAKKRQQRGGARPVQVGEQVREVIAEVLRDGKLKDPRIGTASLVTVTDVKMTPDLREGRAFVSVYGAPENAEVLAGLNAAAGLVQREIGERLGLRYTPKLRFEEDTSIAYGAKIESLLKEIDDEDGGD